MPQVLQDNLALVIIALVVAAALAFWLFHASRKTRVEIAERPEGEGVARRNQALIDAPSAAEAAMPRREAADERIERQEIAEVAPGPTSAAANFDRTAAATEIADAEAGAPGNARDAMKEVPAELAERPAPAASEGDDLLRIKGVGPKIVNLLAGLGVTSFAQIAAWDDAEIVRIDDQLGRFQGRIARDEWVEQARFLAADDITGYEERFGKL
ncbi:hypothetical protein [Aurantiacibacter luteus]|uniref:Uncharacterized protein n=1 Tax=Aurantiacibacter luteus TaxID=1581420 RepID=A0A0G9MWK5_9SPHN|nr:hypothetical protein [Aurantiacibacter luteus]KLE34984.1 hypothetical protein AAW00_00295 [Aurantiacibacter luteus]